MDCLADAVQAGLVDGAKHVRGNASRWRGLIVKEKKPTAAFSLISVFSGASLPMEL